MDRILFQVPSVLDKKGGKNRRGRGHARIGEESHYFSPCRLKLDLLMTQSIILNAHDTLDQLRSVMDTVSQALPNSADSAVEWINAIDSKRAFLADPSHPVVFMGSVGVGKSSLIAVAANLIIGSSPTDRSSLKNNSVLAIGSGRTTVCEVRIRASGPIGKVGLIIEPLSLDEMSDEIRIYAEGEWSRQQPNSRGHDEDELNPTAQEVQRVIRGMTDYKETQEYRVEENVRRRVFIRTMELAASKFSSAEAFYLHLLERAKLSARNSTVWWWDETALDALKELKDRFESINDGLEPSAMLPKRMSVVVPNPLPGSVFGPDLTLIDTRGLDGIVESRRDLQNFLRDPRAVIVLCATFKDAPGDPMRALMRSMANDAELRLAISRTVLLILDQGDADQVNGSGGDREYGQDLKINECFTSLAGGGLRMIDKDQIIAFDALKDRRSNLLLSIDESIHRVRRTVENQLARDIEYANGFIHNFANELRPARRDAVDQQLLAVMALHPLSETPLDDPLSGAYGAISMSRYASVVYATCRRKGAYLGLNLYAAVEAEASRAVTMWMDELISAVSTKLNDLEQDPFFSIVLDHVRLRQRQYLDAQINVSRDYSSRIGSEVEGLLKQQDGLWESCCAEWGAGDGFKAKVVAHLKTWSSKQLGLKAHESTDASSEIPLLREIFLPARPPSFSLHIRNLRALTAVSWTPEPVSILIGANGTGKSSLLLMLKLMRMAYERSLPEALVAVLGGTNNLRSWCADSDDPIEIGVDIGNAGWRIQLVPGAGTSEYFTNERLTDRGREIFSRDSLGNFVYGAERITSSSHLGIRTLIDRGAVDPSLRAVATFLKRSAVYHDPDIWSVRENGSSTAERGSLQARGGNVLAVLRKWSQEKQNRHRYDFVLRGLNAAFPGTVVDMDFSEAGNTLAAQIYAHESEIPKPLGGEANGLLQLLILFTDVASAEDESVLAIDEPENSLHPYAVRVFLQKTTRWVREHNITVILATHSTVLLDELTGSPEKVFVMKAPTSDGVLPTRIDQLYDRKWLQEFRLGDLYEQGEIGSNEDER